MAEVAIQLAGAGKRYTKYLDQPLLLTRALRLRTKREQLWALRDVDLDIERGASFGVVGRNGAGKSTMLQLMAGVTAPTEGRVRVQGRIAPLISVGVGFHPELTGRENVYVNGTILGASRRQVDAAFDAIVAFAEVEDFIDTPVKFYSSGMLVRLGFAAAIHSDPDVLLVDEVLAVGDLGFQLKCFDRMAEIRRSGATVVVVSHNLSAVRALCDTTAVIHQGRLDCVSPTADALSRYHELLGEGRSIDDILPGEVADLAGYVEVESFQLLGPTGPTHHINSGDEIAFELIVRFLAPVQSPTFGLHIATGSGVAVYGEGSRGIDSGDFDAGERVRCRASFPSRLSAGSFLAVFGIRANVGSARARAHLARPSLSFFVTGDRAVGGVVDLAADFEIVREPGGT